MVVRVINPRSGRKVTGFQRSWFSGSSVAMSRLRRERMRMGANMDESAI
jgi:hypothetical protein